MTDSLDERRPRRFKSSSLTRSARVLAQHDHRCRSTRFNVGTDLSSGRRESSAASAWPHRRPPGAADCCRNGRSTTLRSAVIERAQDDIRRPGPTERRSATDDGASAAAAGFSPTLMTDVREVRRLMTALQSHFAAKDAVELVARDWRLVATCLDRSLFCLYCVVVAVSLVANFPSSEA